MTIKNYLSISLTALGIVSFSAHAQTPFTPGQNVAISKPGNNAAAKVYTIYTNSTASSGTYTPGVTFAPAYNINGIGLNAADNFVYGAAFTGNSNNIATAFNISLFRIGSDGGLVDLGLLPITGTAGSGSLEFVNMSAGTVSLDGKYYYSTYAIKPAAMGRITTNIALGGAPDLTAADMRMFICWKDALASLPGNPGGSISLTGFYEVDFSDADITASLNAFLAQVNASYPAVFDADGGVQDIAINPTNGQVYGYMSYPSGGSVAGRPVVLSTPSAGLSTVTPVGSTVNMVPGKEAAGIQFDAAGNLYTLFTTGGFSQIDLTTGAVVGITASNLSVAGGNLRGDLASVPTIVTLPVSLVSFAGKNNGAVNELNWITASEHNSKDFTVERSADQKNWTSAGIVATKAVNGNSHEKLTYAFNDNAPLGGTNYYRLKQRDLDGKQTYSQVVTILSANANISMFPNPTHDAVTVTGLHAGNMIVVCDIAGKVISTQTAVNATAHINLGALPANMYVVQVMDNGQVLQRVKVIKK